MNQWIYAQVKALNDGERLAVNQAWTIHGHFLSSSSSFLQLEKYFFSFWVIAALIRSSEAINFSLSLSLFPWPFLNPGSLGLLLSVFGLYGPFSQYLRERKRDVRPERETIQNEDWIERISPIRLLLNGTHTHTHANEEINATYVLLRARYQFWSFSLCLSFFHPFQGSLDSCICLGSGRELARQAGWGSASCVCGASR